MIKSDLESIHSPCRDNSVNSSLNLFHSSKTLLANLNFRSSKWLCDAPTKYLWYKALLSLAYTSLQYKQPSSIYSQFIKIKLHSFWKLLIMKISEYWWSLCWRRTYLITVIKIFTLHFIQNLNWNNSKMQKNWIVYLKIWNSNGKRIKNWRKNF